MATDLWKQAYRAQYGTDPDQDRVQQAEDVEAWRVNWQSGLRPGRGVGQEYAQPASPPLPVTPERLPEPEAYCELCAAPAVLRVVRWTILLAEEPEPLAQQTHWFCTAHEPQAEQMEALLWDAWRRRSPHR